MKDPIDMPSRSVHRFVCINLVTGFIRNEKVMTAKIATRINSYNHMKDSNWMWLWNDQYDFNKLLNDDARLVPHA